MGEFVGGLAYPGRISRGTRLIDPTPERGPENGYTDVHQQARRQRGGPALPKGYVQGIGDGGELGVAALLQFGAAVNDRLSLPSVWGNPGRQHVADLL